LGGPSRIRSRTPNGADRAHAMENDDAQPRPRSRVNPAVEKLVLAAALVQVSEASTQARPCAGSAASMAMSSPPRSPIISSRITETGTASCWARCRACVAIVNARKWATDAKAGKPEIGYRRDIGVDGWQIDPRHPVNRKR